jgi:putative ABC transport system permease protein
MAQGNLSQNHWAIKLGLSRGHWSAIVNGKHPFPSPRTRERMLEVFGIAFDELFDVESGPAEGSDATFQAALADKYLIEREIGQGGMGTVYLTRDVKHNRMVALKVVSPEAVSGIGTQQFLKEIRLTARLQHHHILPLYDSGEAAGFPYYVMPYIESGSLREYLRRKKQLSMDEAMQLARGIAAALMHAHEHSVLHCDVKPENVLVSDLHAFVADFGISRAVHAEFFEWGKRSELDSSAGTPAYVSPEQASGEPNLDQRSDVYSFACVVWEMLAGRPPFKGTTTMETVAQRFTAMPDLKRFAPHIPRPVAKVIAAGMALRGESRPETPSDFVQALEAAAAQKKSFLTDTLGLAASRAVATVRRLVGTKPSKRRQRFMDSVVQDFRYAVRSLMRQPALAAIVGLTLALGIGMNTAIFSVLYGVLFQPLPYQQPDELIRIGRTRPELPTVLLPISVPNFIDFKPQITQLAAFEGETPTQLIVETNEEASRVRGLQVTTGFFDLFGVPAQLGRTFVPEDGVPGAEQVVVLGDGFWRDRLGSDPDVVGTTIRLSENPYTIAGIAPPGFDFGRASLWIPFQWHVDSIPSRDSNFIRLYGRVEAGVDVQAATAELHALWTALGEQYADNYDDSGMRAEPLLQAAVSRSRTPLLILAGAVGLVLLVACANVVNIMLARSEARYREIAVRAALGAGRGRLFRQFLTESLVLSLTGGAVGLGAAYAGVRVIVGLYGSDIPRSDEIGISGIALGFAVLVSVLTGVLVGLAPALQAKPNHAALKEGGRGASGRITTVRQGLVIAEVALALMLVTGTGVLLKSFWRATQSDMGFNGENLLIVNLWTPPSRYQNYTERATFYESLLPQLTALPTVQHAAMSSLIPARAFGNNYTTIAVVGREDERESHFVENRRVTQTYFETLDMRLILGRIFTDADLSTGGVIVINEELVRQLFDEGENPLGARLGDGWQNPPEIVGVVNDVRSFGPDERPRPTMYWPVAASTNLVLRTAGDPLQVVPQIRQTLTNLDPAVRIFRVDTMSDILVRSLGDRRFQLALLIVFGGVALLLGAVGIYGVMSYTVAQRTRELGVRLALGSSTNSLLRLVLRQGTILALIGVGVGAAGALATRRVLANMVFDVSTSDPITYGVVALLLTGVAALACYIPARRAAKVDPMEALRYE